MRQRAYILRPAVMHGSNVMLHVRCFSPTVPQMFTYDITDCLSEYLNTLIVFMCIFIGIACCRKHLYAGASNDSQPEK